MTIRCFVARSARSACWLVLLVGRFCSADESLPSNYHCADNKISTAAVAELADSILYHRQRYESGLAPEISDSAYDQLVRRLAALAQCSPSFAAHYQRTTDSPANRSQHKVPHLRPMLSLNKAYSFADAKSFFTGELASRALVQPKLDGIAVELQYSEGTLVSAATRGDGAYGSDITGLLNRVSPLPKRLPSPSSLAVYGELVATRPCFEQLGSDYVSTRHMVAGMAAAKEHAAAHVKCLRFYPYGLYELQRRQQRDDIAALSLLTKWGFSDLLAHTEIVDSEQQLILLYGNYFAVSKSRGSALVAASAYDMGLDLDGIVIKAITPQGREQRGETAQAPEWAMAWKFQQPVAVTKVMAIEWKQGRTGKVTPVLQIEPVALSGRKISKVSGRSSKWLQSKQIGVGTQLELELKGDAVPQVVGVVSRPEPLAMQHALTHVPQQTSTGGDLCLSYNPSCETRFMLQVKYALSAFKYRGVGEKKIQQWIAKASLSTLADIFSLPPLDTELRPFIPLNTKDLLSMLGVPGLKTAAAQRLARKYPTPTQISQLSEAELRAVTGIGEVSAGRLYRLFRRDEVQQLIAQR
ncbi:helix-hairpin-helix domain-containing protein [Corallincola spongiicola]|nr:helix-hairpin-helix domain-containing protein [Corallincola spongiicola]